jgi:hypothetical protein
VCRCASPRCVVRPSALDVREADLQGSLRRVVSRHRGI